MAGDGPAGLGRTDVRHPPRAIAQSNPPATPSSVSITRADGSLTASWPAVANATTYHVTYSSNHKQSWQLAALDHPATSGTVSITFNADNTKTYVVGVRAKNSHGGSGWRNSPLAAVQVPAPPASVSVYRGFKFLDVEWPAVSGATGYNVNYTTDSGISWNRAATGVTNANYRIAGIPNLAGHIVAVQAVNSYGGGHWRNSAPVGAVHDIVKAGSVLASRTANSDTSLDVSWTICNVALDSCNGGTPVTGYHINLSSDGGRSWTRAKTVASYTSGARETVDTGVRGDENYIVAVGVETRFNTAWTNSAPVAANYHSVSNRDETEGGVNNVSAIQRWAAGFTTGGNPSGYTVQSIAAKVQESGVGTGAFSLAVHTSTTKTINNKVRVIPDATVQATLSGSSNPSGLDTWTCSGNGCILKPDTAYFLMATFSGAGANTFQWPYTNSDDETARPSGNGWSIGIGWYSDYNTATSTWSDWDTWLDVGQFEVRAALGGLTVPDAPANVSAYRGLGFLDVEWDAVSGVAGYDVRWRNYYTGWAWSIDNVTITGATARIADIPNHGIYRVEVRSRNAQGNFSAWQSSAHVHPADPPGAITSLRTQRSAGEIRVWWSHCDVDLDSCNGGSPLTGYAVNVSDNGGHSWTRVTTLETYRPGDRVTIGGSGGGDQAYIIDDTKTYLVAVAALSRMSGYWVRANVSQSLAVTNVTATGATLTLFGHGGDWWYQGDQANAACTAVAAGTTTASLSSLAPGTSYTYKAYSDNGCGDTHVIADTTFTTDGLSVSNLGEGVAENNETCIIGVTSNHRYECGTPFTTGSATGGYTVHSITAKFGKKYGTPGDIRVTLRASSGSNPASTPLVTLSGASPTGKGESTFTCSGAGCALLPDTTYWLHMAAPNSSTSSANVYYWDVTAADGQTPIPSSNGWTIGDVSKYRGVTSGAWCTGWCDITGSVTGMFSVNVTVNP